MRIDEIIQKLRSLRLESKLSQEEVGEIIGVGRTQVVNIENGHRGTPIERLQAYAGAVGCRILVQLLPSDSEITSIQVDADTVELANKISALEESQLKMVLLFLEVLPLLDDVQMRSLSYEWGLRRDKSAEDSVA